VSRKFVWTPVTAQGVCSDPLYCTYVVKFQVGFYQHSVLRTDNQPYLDLFA
jgi:hypothetical protein